MSKIQLKIDQEIDTQKLLINEISADYVKMDKGNKAAIIRMRSAEMELSKLCKSIRVNLQAFKEEQKSLKK